MGTIHVIGQTYPAKVVTAKALEDMETEGYDQVLIVMGSPDKTDVRWSTMTNSQLSFLIHVAQSELMKRL